MSVQPVKWRERAECRPSNGYDPDWWWPSTLVDEVIPLARQVCLECPVRVECRAFADDEGITDGIWGGATPVERGIDRAAARRLARAKAEAEAQAQAKRARRRKVYKTSQAAIDFGQAVMEAARELDKTTPRDDIRLIQHRLDQLGGIA